MKQLIFFFLFVSALPLFSQDENYLIGKGNDAFVDGDYVDAEESYREAMSQKPDSYKATFNLADALYKQEKYQDALKELEILAHNETEKSRLADVYHNMGNCYMKANDYQNSVDAFKKSLRNNPKSEETRYNLAYAQQKLKEQQQQQQNQQNQDQQNQDQNDNKDKQDQQDKNKDENKDKDQKDKDQDKQDQNQDQQDKNKDQQDKNKDKKDQQNQDQQKQQKNQISKEDAERMLEALQQDENKTQEKAKKAELKKAKRHVIEKDW